MTTELHDKLHDKVPNKVPNKIPNKPYNQMSNLLYLLLAIVFETGATSLLKMAEGFTRPLPTAASLVCYLVSLYCLSVCLKTIPIGVAYAIWSALGIVLVTLIGVIAFKQMPDWGAIIGLSLIIAGVVVLNLFSKMTVH
nr:multidrug efflux SMR transporter [Prevotella sp. FD3004]